MKIFQFHSYNDLSKQAADDVIQLMGSKTNPLICVASGDSPTGLYKNLENKVAENKLDISGWSFLGLDEWIGLNGNDEGSCRFHLNNQLFVPLKVPEDHLYFFDGRTNHPEQECQNAEDFIIQHGGIHVAILGLGLNGHLGMNEPNTSASSRTHVTKLDTTTSQTGQKYFKEKQVLNEGITLGLGTLMESDHILLLANGIKKAEIVKKMVEGEISEDVPATLLRKHPHVSIYLDAEAAGLLDNEKIFSSE